MELKAGARRKIRWDRLRTPRHWLALAIGSAGGAGLAPWAPGTFGTLVGIPIAWVSADWSTAARMALWGALLLAGTWAARVFGELMETPDHQSLVMDEVVGFGITAWTAGRDPRALVAAFVLFRFFDILKPPPVRQADRWSKQGSTWRQGFGVMFDDVLAGFYALMVMLLLQGTGWIH